VQPSAPQSLSSEALAPPRKKGSMAKKLLAVALGAGTGMKRYQDIKISSTDNYIEEDEEESGEDELVFTQED
jgi:hypothetical protein